MKRDDDKAPKAEFDPGLALRALSKHEVRFVLIGGLAANVLGSPSVTRDLDICYARDPANLVALVGALRELNARLRGVEQPVPFRLDERSLRNGDSFTFITSAGPLDILGTPSGSGGYEELVKDSLEVELTGVRVKVVSIDSLIRMKQAAGRRKDLIEVEVLEALKEEMENERPA